MMGMSARWHFCAACITGFTALGGVYLPNVKITGIATAPRNFLLETNLGTIQAERAVLAAGLGNAALASHFGLKAPVCPQRGQVLVTERTRAALPMPTTTIRQTGEGTIMLGDSVEEVGFDTRQSQPVMAEIAHRAALCFPWIGKLNVVRAWSALRVMSPDGLPIYDQSETLPGAYHGELPFWCDAGRGTWQVAGTHDCARRT
jgi:glycine/D-amino acid oxidase-like deaminating enzyme